MLHAVLKNTGKIILLVIILTVRSYAADLSSEIRDNKIALGETTILSFRVSGNNQDISPIQIPVVPGLSIAYSGVQTNFESINGRGAYSKNIMFTVTGKKSGKYTIPPFLLNISGKVQKTSEITIIVTRELASNRKPGNISFKSEVNVSPKKAYVGEPVLLRYYLIYSGIRNIRVNGIEKQPDAKGFIIKKIDESISDKYLGSKTKVHLMTFVLIPTEEGSYEIGAGNIIIAADTEGSFFDMMQQKRIVFPQEKVQVLPLPVNDRPDSFKGAVGKFKISVEKYESRAKLFEEKVFFLKVSGTGNFFTLPKPVLKKKPDGLKVIIEESDPEYSLNKNTFKGEKKYTAIIIPEKSGRIKPGAFIINFFNSETGRYETCESEELALDVVDSGLKKESQPIKRKTNQEISFSPLIIISIVIVILIAAFSIFKWEKKRIATIKAAKLKKTEHTDNHNEKKKNDYLTDLVKAAESGDTDKFLKFAEKLLAFSDQTIADPDQISSLKNKIYGCKFGGAKITPEDMKTILEFFIKK
jgi:hypothetical protein